MQEKKISKEKKKWHHKANAVFWVIWTRKLLGMKGVRKQGSTAKEGYFLKEKGNPGRDPVVSQIGPFVHCCFFFFKVKNMEFNDKPRWTFALIQSVFLYKHFY